MKALPYLLVTNVRRVDDAECVLTQLHYLFRHEEMEVFVPESHVADAAALMQCAVRIFAADATSLPEAAETRVRAVGLYDELMHRRGSYVLHYPMLFRRVLPDDTLISMTGAAREPWFSFSLFSYEPPGKRSAYYDVCSWVARAMHALFGARLHWGKHYPLGEVETARMYPGLPTFLQLCRARDPAGNFSQRLHRQSPGTRHTRRHRGAPVTSLRKPTALLNRAGKPRQGMLNLVVAEDPRRSPGICILHDDVARLFAHHVYGGNDKEAGDFRKHRRVDHPEAARPVHPEPTVDNRHAVAGHAHPAGAARMVSPCIVLDEAAESPQSVCMAAPGKDLSGDDCLAPSVDATCRFEALHDRCQIVIGSLAVREVVEVDFRDVPGIARLERDAARTCCGCGP